MTPRRRGKMVRMVSEMSLTESSMPPICAKAGMPIRSIAQILKNVFFMMSVFVAKRAY
tara:strand:+ start:21771 stop:21944 length:174 start_codon:yes stop_codon:yes gene_type:complete